MPKFTYLVWSRLRVLADTLLLYLVSFLSKIDYKLNIKQCTGDTLKKSFIINETQRKISQYEVFIVTHSFLVKLKLNLPIPHPNIPFVY